MAIGQELLNVPMGDMIRQMAFAIADGQYKLDENSINVAEMMGGLTTVYDERGDVTFDDSRVFFGYEYMTVKEARAYAAVDDALSGSMDDDTIKLGEVLDKIIKSGDTDDTEIRVPVRHSMMELGFTPTFYQFVDTLIELKMSISVSRETNISRSSTQVRASVKGSVGFFSATAKMNVSSVSASYSSKYQYSAEGSSLIRTKLVPVPAPAILEQRIRSMIASTVAAAEGEG